MFFLLYCLSVLPHILCTSLWVHLHIFYYCRLYGRVLSLKFLVKLHKRKITDLASTANLSFLSTSEGIPKEYVDALRRRNYYTAYEYRRELTTHGNFLKDCLCPKRCKTGKIHIYLACIISIAGLVSNEIHTGSVNNFAITFNWIVQWLILIVCSVFTRRGKAK